MNPRLIKVDSEEPDTLLEGAIKINKNFTDLYKKTDWFSQLIEAMTFIATFFTMLGVLGLSASWLDHLGYNEMLVGIGILAGLIATILGFVKLFRSRGT